MTGRPVTLVARREIKQRVRSKTFLLSTLAVVLGVVAAMLIPSFASDGDETVAVGLVGQAPAPLLGLLSAGAEAAGAELETHRYATIGLGERALRDREVEVLVVDGSRLVWESEPDDRLRVVAVGALQRLEVQRRAAGLGLTAEDREALLAPQPVPERRLEPADPDEDARYAAALLGILLLILSLTLYGQALAYGVAREKASRVMEVLLARVSVRELLAGKVLGIGLVGLAQLVVALVASLAVILAVDRVDVPSAVPSMVGWVILWFVLGYAFYSVIYAALGALVSRVEDVESAQAPLGWMIVACSLLAVYAADSPDAWLSRVASFVPVTAPFVVPVRIAVSDVAAWEVVLAVAIMIVSTYAVVRAAAGVYAGAVLRAGPRLRGMDIWRAARAARIGIR
jgi:ABC-2 type transport system permease protein